MSIFYTEATHPAALAMSDDEYRRGFDEIVEGLKRLRDEAYATQDQRGVPRSNFHWLHEDIRSSEDRRENRLTIMLEVYREELLNHQTFMAGFLYGIDSAEFETALVAGSDYLAARFNESPEKTLPARRHYFEKALSHYYDERCQCLNYDEIM